MMTRIRSIIRAKRRGELVFPPYNKLSRERAMHNVNHRMETLAERKQRRRRGIPLPVDMGGVEVQVFRIPLGRDEE